MTFRLHKVNLTAAHLSEFSRNSTQSRKNRPTRFWFDVHQKRLGARQICEQRIEVKEQHYSLLRYMEQVRAIPRWFDMTMRCARVVIIHLATTSRRRLSSLRDKWSASFFFTNPISLYERLLLINQNYSKRFTRLSKFKWRRYRNSSHDIMKWKTSSKSWCEKKLKWREKNNWRNINYEKEKKVKLIIRQWVMIRVSKVKT